MSTIAEALTALRQRIIQTAHMFNRSPDDICLLAVSKTRSAADVMTAAAAGQKHFGENYVQEALDKINTISCQAELEWHFIGPIQSNKTKAIAEHFTWVHSLDDHRHAQRLNNHRPVQLPPLNVCIQVNISAEPQKSGIALNELPHLVETVSQLPRLKLRGLMALPAPTTEFEQQRLPFHRLRQALEALREQGIDLDTLSMGMTEDMDAAIAEGATIVRVGTAIFGRRSN